MNPLFSGEFLGGSLYRLMRLRPPSCDSEIAVLETLHPHLRDRESGVSWLLPSDEGRQLQAWLEQGGWLGGTRDASPVDIEIDGGQLRVAGVPVCTAGFIGGEIPSGAEGDRSKSRLYHLMKCYIELRAYLDDQQGLSKDHADDHLFELEKQGLELWLQFTEYEKDRSALCACVPGFGQGATHLEIGSDDFASDYASADPCRTDELPFHLMRIEKDAPFIGLLHPISIGHKGARRDWRLASPSTTPSVLLLGCEAHCSVAANELGMLIELFSSSGWSVQPPPANDDDLHQYFHSCKADGMEPDIIHYVGHQDGNLLRPTGDPDYLWDASKVRDQLQVLRNPGPSLVFLNACGSRRAFSRSLTKAGVPITVTTEAKLGVREDGVHRSSGFARDFYANLLNGSMTVGESLLEARKRDADVDHRCLTWTQYVMSGNPSLRVGTPPPSVT
jgi:hypothetical protein